QQFTVTTLNDAVLEGAETFTVNLSATDALVDDSDTATGTINDTPTTGDGLFAEYFDDVDLVNLSLTRIDATVDFGWGGGSPDPSIGVDTFSARWTGQVEPLFTETYTFQTTTDDGVRLWIDNQLIIARWVDQAPTSHTGQIALVAGQRYDIRMEYYEKFGGAVARLLWSSASQSLEVVPQSQLYAGGGPPTIEHGLAGEYYDNIDLTNLVTTRTDVDIDFNWGGGSPNPAIASDTFSVRWTGQIEALFTETYTFHTTTDDGVRLWIDGQLIVDKWVDQSASTHTGNIDLIAGQRYDIIMEYFENGGLANAALRWSSASQPLEIVPNSQLFTGSASLLLVASEVIAISEAPAHLTTSQLAPVVDAAVHYWKAAGLKTKHVAALDQIVVQIADLPGTRLGETSGTTITLDVDAAGIGWFVDATPADSLEYTATTSHSFMATEGEAARRIDLLTAVMHEMGHVLGLEEMYGDESEDDLMYGWLANGVRRIPTLRSVDAFFAADEDIWMGTSRKVVIEHAQTIGSVDDQRCAHLR
ncbi:MAG: PA14 domain-containing protein, partial [Pirellulales bacterium]